MAVPLRDARCLCTGCGEVFSTEHNFDLHRVFACGHRHHVEDCWDTRRCLTSAEMGAKGLERKPNGVWAGLAREGVYAAVEQGAA